MYVHIYLYLIKKLRTAIPCGWLSNVYSSLYFVVFFYKKNKKKKHIVNILVNVITDAPNINTVINDPLMLHSCILYAVTPLVQLNRLFLPLWRIKFDNIL